MYIHSIAHFHPDNIIDNRFLEDLNCGTDDEWIVSRTGIRARHTVLPLDYLRCTLNKDLRATEEAALFTDAETGRRAASIALDRAGLKASDIGMVIQGGSAPAFRSPAGACLVADRLGIAVPCFDVNSACSSWVVQLHLLSMMNKDALPDFVLIVNTDNLTKTVDYSDRRNAVLMGDGTTATIVSSRVRSSIQVRNTYIESDPSGWEKVVIGATSHFQQVGGAVQNFAIRRTVAVIEKLRDEAGSDFWFVGHQANLMMLQSACTRAAVNPARHLYNVDVRGNCGAAGASGVISEKMSSLHAGDRVLVAVLGSGLSWAGAVLLFDEGGRL